MLDRLSSELDTAEAMKVYREVGATEREMALLDLSLSSRQPEMATSAASNTAR